MIDNEELRKKIIDSYDSKLKDIFTEDEILAILDALKPSVLTNTSLWPTITTNSNDLVYRHNNMFKTHQDSEPIYKVDPVLTSNVVTNN